MIYRKVTNYEKSSLLFGKLFSEFSSQNVDYMLNNVVFDLLFLGLCLKLHIIFVGGDL